MKNRNVAAFLAVSALALGTAQTASAADLPRKAPPMAAPIVAPVYNWTGFYFGGHAGWGWNENDSGTTFVPGGLAFGGTGGVTGAGAFGVSNDTDGGMLGAQIGVNYQINMWVVGIEADLSWVDWDRGYTVGPLLDAVGVAIPGSFQTASGGMDWFGTVRGRLGFAANNLLVYITGGFAFGDTDHSVTTSFLATGGGVFTATGGDTRAGWTFGGGLEWGFAPNWSVKAEYLYYDLGDTTISSTIGPDTVTTTFDNDGHIARIGLNYRFGWGGGAPIAARY
jgi:outer membrane immunogenic protein